MQGNQAPESTWIVEGLAFFQLQLPPNPSHLWNLSELILDGNQIEGKEVTIDHDGNEFKYDIHDKQENNIEDTKEPATEE